VTGDIDLSWLSPVHGHSSTLDWQSVAVTGLEGAGVVNGVMQLGGLLIMTGAIGNPDYTTMIPTAWTTTNGRDWTAHEMDVTTDEFGLALGSPVLGGPGLVAVGDQYVFLSFDGRSWQVIQDAEFTGASLRGLTSANGVLLVSRLQYGPEEDEFDMFRSLDGMTWSLVAGRNAEHVATGLMNVVSVDDAFLAFVAHNGERYGADAIEIWRSTDGIDWAPLSDIPNSGETEGVAVVPGGPGVLAVSGHGLFAGYDKELAIAWTSADGVDWTQTRDAPFAPSDLLGVGPGFVAVGGHFPKDGTGIQYEDSVTGDSWTSADGESWRKVGQPGKGREIEQLVVLGDYVAGYGLDFNSKALGAMWITPTPDF
jgi:hypothetical protein